jgi:hypothetical protein
LSLNGVPGGSLRRIGGLTAVSAIALVGERWQIHSCDLFPLARFCRSISTLAARTCGTSKPATDWLGMERRTETTAEGEIIEELLELKSKVER